MASQEDAVRIALALSGVSRAGDDFEFRVNGRLFLHAWLERVDPKKARVPSDEVVVIRVRDEMDKQTLLATGGPAIFTEPHFDGWPSVLVRLSEIDYELLEKLIIDSYDIAVAKGAPRSRRKAKVDL